MGTLWIIFVTFNKFGNITKLKLPKILKKPQKYVLWPIFIYATSMLKLKFQPRVMGFLKERKFYGLNLVTIVPS